MSLYSTKDFGYLQQAEAFFLRMSQRGLMLGSKDAELLRHWQDSALPISVVCAGIKRAFDEYQTPPRSISQCLPMVERELEAWRERHAGGHEEIATKARRPLPGKDLPDPTDPERRRKREKLRRAQKPDPAGEAFLSVWHRSIWRLVELGQSCDTELGRQCYRWAYKEMQSLRQQALTLRHDPEIRTEVPLAIGEIEALMFERFYEALSAREREQIEAEIPAQVRDAMEMMSADARGHQERQWRRRALEAQLNLRPFFTP